MFEFGVAKLRQEKMKKYDRVSGQAQMNFLALSKKSQQRIANSYLQSRSSHEKMDNLVERLKFDRVFNQ